MSMTDQYKRQKDRSRFRKEIKRDPNLIRTSLKIIFNGESKPDMLISQKQAASRLRSHFRNSHMDTAILSHLVGLGYLRPVADRYLATRLVALFAGKLLGTGQNDGGAG